MKVGRVTNRRVSSKWNIEFPALVKTAETIKASPIQIIEELRGFAAFRAAVFDELVEACAVRIEKLLVVTRVNLHRKPAPQLRVEVDQVRIKIIQHCALRPQTQRDRQPSAKQFHITALMMPTPEWFKVRHQPALPTGPLQRRPGAL